MNGQISVQHGVARRGFLARLGLGLAGLTGVVMTPAGLRAETLGAGSAQPDPDAWLAALQGKHRQIFDAPTLGDGKALLQAKNFLDAYRDAYGAKDGEVSVAVGVHGGAFPLVFRDEVWQRFGFGERFSVSDPATRRPAVRNLFARARPGDPLPEAATVEALQQRGVVFLLCNNTLGRTTAALAGAGFGAAPAVRQELLAGLLPGVQVVPAMVVALSRAQEKGFSYVYAG